MLNLNDYQEEMRKEEIRHTENINKLRIESKAYQKICKHDKGSHYWDDPSGNNGSWYQCKECGKEI